MASLNKCLLIGNLTRDPEVRYLPNSDAVCNFAIATSETWKDKSGVKQEKTEFHNIVMYRKLAEIAGEYLKKGAPVYIEGRLQTRKWEKDGVTRYTTEIIGDSMQMLGGKSDNNASSNSDTPSKENNAPQSEIAPNDNGDARQKSAFAEFDDDIPFLLARA